MLKLVKDELKIHYNRITNIKIQSLKFTKDEVRGACGKLCTNWLKNVCLFSKFPKYQFDLNKF